MLEQLRKMKPEEFDSFFEQDLSMRKKQAKSILSPEQTALVQRINRGLPAELQARSERLVNKRKRSRLTAVERNELLQITNIAESLDADRAAALAELAKLRGVPIRVLMEEMGIKPPPIHD